MTICSAALLLAAVVAARRPVADREAWQLAVFLLAGVLALVLAVEEPPVTGGTLRYREVAVVRGVQLLLLAGLMGWQLPALRRAGPVPVAQR